LKNSPQHLSQASGIEYRVIKNFKAGSFHNFPGSIFENGRILLNFYSLDCFRELRFYKYVGQQKAGAALVNIFANGGKTYRNVQVPARTPRGYFIDAHSYKWSYIGN
jgi:hypothetical protein